MLMRIYSLLFTTLLSLFVAALGIFSLATGTKNIKMGMLPFWKGDALLYWLAVLGLLGLISVFLAVMKKTKALLVLYTFAAFCLIVYGYFISPVYSFSGAAEARGAAWFAFGALGAFIGALLHYHKASQA
jgi:hypothetical protein